MSEVKINEEHQDNPVVEETTLDDGVEENNEVADLDQNVDEPPKGPEQELAEAKEQIADLQDRMLRAAAENENFKKRVERDRLASLKYAGEAIFREVLPTVDNLERALTLGVVDGAD